MSDNKLMELLYAARDASKNREAAFNGEARTGSELATAHQALVWANEQLSDFLLNRLPDLERIFVRAKAHDEEHRDLADAWEVADNSATDSEYEWRAAACEEDSRSLNDWAALMFAELHQALADGP